MNHNETPSCEKLAFTVIYNDGRAGEIISSSGTTHKYTQSCFWISAHQALIACTDDIVLVPTLEEIRTRCGFPDQSIEYDNYHHNNCAKKFATLYKIQIDIYGVNITGAEGSGWIGTHCHSYSPENKDIEDRTRRFAFAGWRDDFELIITKTPTTDAVESKKIAKSHPYSKRQCITKGYKYTPMANNTNNTNNNNNIVVDFHNPVSGSQIASPYASSYASSTKIYEINRDNYNAVFDLDTIDHNNYNTVFDINMIDKSSDIAETTTIQKLSHNKCHIYSKKYQRY